jgi:hypothetical protein
LPERAGGRLIAPLKRPDIRALRFFVFFFLPFFLLTSAADIRIG